MDAATTKYELMERIGFGGMAEVFRARIVGAAGFSKTVAVKRILPYFSDEPELISRFVDEARITARLQHSNICQVLDFGMMEGQYFLAMELVEGLDLARLLAVLGRRGEDLAPRLCLEIARGVLRGLHFAHTAKDVKGGLLGIVHRDVSPQNVLLSVSGEVKVSDFGAATAKAELRSFHTVANVALGKRLYMAPEQRMGQPVDARTDVHGAGLLLAEMIVGASKFNAEAVDVDNLCAAVERVARERFPDGVGERVAAAVARAIETAPYDRYPDARSMWAELETLAAQLGRAPEDERLAALVSRLVEEAAAEKSDAEGSAQPVSTEAVSLKDASVAETVVYDEEAGAEGSSGYPVFVDAATTVMDDRPGEKATVVIRGRRRAEQQGLEELETEISPSATGDDAGHDGAASSNLEALETTVLSGDRDDGDSPADMEELETRIVSSSRSHDSHATEDDTIRIERGKEPWPENVEELETRIHRGSSERAEGADEPLGLAIPPTVAQEHVVAPEIRVHVAGSRPGALDDTIPEGLRVDGGAEPIPPTEPELGRGAEPIPPTEPDLDRRPEGESSGEGGLRRAETELVSRDSDAPPRRPAVALVVVLVVVALLLGGGYLAWERGLLAFGVLPPPTPSGPPRPDPTPAPNPQLDRPAPPTVLVLDAGADADGIADADAAGDTRAYRAEPSTPPPPTSRSPGALTPARRPPFDGEADTDRVPSSL